LDVLYLESVKKTLLAPLERYKLIKQNQNSIISVSSQERYKNIMDYMKNNQNIKNGFRGNITNIVSVIAKLECKFFCYQNIKLALINLDESNNPMFILQCHDLWILHFFHYSSLRSHKDKVIYWYQQKQAI
jgi:hypothetical protein